MPDFTISLSSATTMVVINVVAIVVFVTLIVLNFVAIFLYDDVPCNVDHHRMGLNLTDFLLWFTVSKLVCVGGLIAMLSGTLCLFGCRNKGAPLATVIISAVFLILVGLFMLAWSIVGAIILFQDCIDCIKDQTFIGILSLINLILFWAGVPTFVSSTTTTKTGNSDD